uniref:LAGLIDADG homing endonuclease n=1 Tax=Sporothrix stenoceras TaxID=5173 RepID=M9NSB7_9PEZI|nr:LAGLIDADG homing endonuclease [Sporothrix stenoceras]
MNINNNTLLFSQAVVLPIDTCWFISGLIDAEGSFGVNVVKHSTNSTGFAVLISFEVGMNSKDKSLLEMINNNLELNCKIYNNISDDTVKLKVSNLDTIVNKVIPFFNKYTLFTQKKGDFILMTKVVDIIKNKEHLKLEGLADIIKIKSVMNLGLSDKLKSEFSYLDMSSSSKGLDIKRSELYSINYTDINNSWLAGFIEGEACFFVSIYDSPKSKLGKAVQLVFKITQHIRDKHLLENIRNLLNCGRVEIRNTNEACDLTVTSFKEFKEHVIPFLENYRLLGQKLYNYNDFKLVYDIMLMKGHLTEEGLEKIVEIKNRMNTKR